MEEEEEEEEETFLCVDGLIKRLWRTVIKLSLA